MGMRFVNLEGRKAETPDSVPHFLTSRLPNFSSAFTPAVHQFTAACWLSCFSCTLHPVLPLAGCGPGGEKNSRERRRAVWCAAAMPFAASIIIPTFGRPEPLRGTLEDLAKVRPAGCELLIIDQSPEPFPAPPALANGLPVRVLHRPPGVVAARNFAAQEARHEVLIFLDDDVRIGDAAFLENHLRPYENPEIDAVCGQELNAPDFAEEPPDRSRFASLYEEAEFFNRRSSEGRPVAHLSTCNCSVRRSSFERVGGFDAAFAGNSYGDDTDLALRLADAGAQIVFEPAASVRHLHWRQGGLRLSDDANRTSAHARHLSSWLVYYRHVPPEWRRWFLWGRILRRQLFLKRNVYRPLRWPGIIAGILSARSAARRHSEWSRPVEKLNQ